RGDRGPAGLGGARAHRRHPVRPGSPPLADRVAAPTPLGPAGPWAALRGGGHRPRHRRSHGADLRPPGRPRRAGRSAMTELSEAPADQRRAVPVPGALRSGLSAPGPAGPGPPPLTAAYERCRQLNRRHGTSYYLATRLLPDWKRPYVHALYGFARYADEIVDDLGNGLSPAQRAEALADWGERFFGYLRAG